MAIYKLKTGKGNSEDASDVGEYPFFDRSSKIKWSNEFILDGAFTIVPGEGIFIPKFYNGKFNLHQRAYAVYSDIFLPKYLFYLITKKKNIFYRFAVGSTVPSLRASSFDWINKEKNIKKLDQQKIIDIIEPIEKSITNINETLSLMAKISNIHCKLNYSITDKKYKFIKGGSPSGVGDTPFLNVSAANKKINRFVSNEPNVTHGEITLSLDGNIGLVNNCLKGFNGYLYKVEHEELKPYEIYYSLLHTHNQNIMKINTTGTTIAHSPNSKKEIAHIEFGNNKLLESFFELELSLKLQIKKLLIIKDNLVKLLIR